MQTQTSSSNWNPGLKNDAVRLGDVYDGMPKDPASAVPWYVRMLENPASPLALPGAIDLFGHDCLHALLGRGLVRFMPHFLRVLAVVGTAAMIWVGGGILVHGLAGYGFTAIEHLIHEASLSVAALVPALGGVLGWFATAVGSGVVGLLVGFALIPIVGRVLAPAWKAVRGG